MILRLWIIPICGFHQQKTVRPSQALIPKHKKVESPCEKHLAKRERGGPCTMHGANSIRNWHFIHSFDKFLHSFLIITIYSFNQKLLFIFRSFTVKLWKTVAVLKFFLWKKYNYFSILSRKETIEACDMNLWVRQCVLVLY